MPTTKKWQSGKHPPGICPWHRGLKGVAEMIPQPLARLRHNWLIVCQLRFPRVVARGEFRGNHFLASGRPPPHGQRPRWDHPASHSAIASQPDRGPRLACGGGDCHTWQVTLATHTADGQPNVRALRPRYSLNTRSARGCRWQEGSPPTSAVANLSRPVMPRTSPAGPRAPAPSATDTSPGTVPDRRAGSTTRRTP